jgi:hypothetical protein
MLVRVCVSCLATCSVRPFFWKSSTSQCLLIRTWKQRATLSLIDDIRYRTFRALRRNKINSTDNLAQQLFESSLKFLVCKVRLFSFVDLSFPSKGMMYFIHTNH